MVKVKSLEQSDDPHALCRFWVRAGHLFWTMFLNCCFNVFQYKRLGPHDSNTHSARTAPKHFIPTHNITSLPYRHTVQAYRTDTQYKLTVPTHNTRLPHFSLDAQCKLTVPTHNTSLPYRHTIQACRAGPRGARRAHLGRAHGVPLGPTLGGPPPVYRMR